MVFVVRRGCLADVQGDQCLGVANSMHKFYVCCASKDVCTVKGIGGGELGSGIFV